MLKIQNLKVTVKDKTIVQNASIHVPPGEIHLLLGKNGSGKSSLSMGIVGHPDYNVTHGSIFIQGKDMTNSLPEERTREGLFMSFQNPPAIEGLSVVQLIKTATNNLREKQNKAPLSAPEFFQKLTQYQSDIGIEQSLLMRSLNVGFSGGEKKKIELLQMKFLVPKIAILDEPDSGVDVNTKRVIAQTVNQLKESEKMSFLIVTHTFDFARELKADKIHIMQNGEITESGDRLLLEKIEKDGFE
ncbi:MAG: Fe-S cluster assembly ATPase SufC [Alphaproteobacteria bacterium]|nr:Fe-S cluster assembly ATPase SufC [Alphaproteobacteria bacterium]